MARAPVEGPDRRLDHLVSKYRKHLDGYREWLTIASEANERLDGDELDGFLNLHEQKHVITERLRAEEGQLRLERDELSADLGLRQFTVEQLESAAQQMTDGESFAKTVASWRDLLAELNTVMQQVAKVERQTEDKLRRRLQSLTDAMSDTRSTRRAVRAYNRPEADGHDARFIDRRG